MESFYIVCDRAVPNRIPNRFLECLGWKDGMYSLPRIILQVDGRLSSLTVWCNSIMLLAATDLSCPSFNLEMQAWRPLASAKQDDELQDWIWPSDLPFSKVSGKRALDFMDFSAIESLNLFVQHLLPNRPESARFSKASLWRVVHQETRATNQIKEIKDTWLFWKHCGTVYCLKCMSFEPGATGIRSVEQSLWIIHLFRRLDQHLQKDWRDTKCSRTECSKDPKGCFFKDDTRSRQRRQCFAAQNGYELWMDDWSSKHASELWN